MIYYQWETGTATYHELDASKSITSAFKSNVYCQRNASIIMTVGFIDTVSLSEFLNEIELNFGIVKSFTNNRYSLKHKRMENERKENEFLSAIMCAITQFLTVYTNRFRKRISEASVKSSTLVSLGVLTDNVTPILTITSHNELI